MEDAPVSSRFLAAAEATVAVLAADGRLSSWIVTRRRADRDVVLAAVDPRFGLAAPGVEVAWEDTVCALVAAGVGEGHAAVLRDHRDYGEAPLATLMPGGGYVGHPLVDGDGVVIGSLCGFDDRPLDHPAALGALVGHHAALLSALLAAERDLEAAATRLSHVETENLVDALTGVGNRRAWDRAVDTSEQRCRSHGDDAAMVLVDVDGLRAVNEGAGRGAGDSVLRAVALTLVDELAAHREATVARISGDEFGILLHGAGHAEADELGRAIAAVMATQGLAVSVGAAHRHHRHGLTGARRTADAAVRTDRHGPARSARSTPVPVRAMSDEAERSIQRLLDALRDQSGMDVAFVGEWVDGERVFRHVSAAAPLRRQLLGTAHPLEDTVCLALVEDPDLGALPDAGAHPVTAGIAVVADFGIGAHLGIPLRLRDGHLYGTLCCAALHPDPAVSARDLAMLHIVAAAIEDRLEDEVAANLRRTVVNRAIDAVLVDGGPAIVFQPVVRMADRAVVGYEALSRFGLALGPDPTAWFGAATQMGRDIELELAAITRALTEARRLGPGWLAVNTSPATLASSGLPAALAGADRPVVVELTEHVALDDVAGVETAIAELRAAGHRISVDDAGIGHSGLARIVALRPDQLKIDRYLVDGVAVDPVRRAAVRLLGEVAEALGAVVVAEGIERAADLAVVEVLGIELAQGYLLHRPAPVGDLVHLV